MRRLLTLSVALLATAAIADVRYTVKVGEGDRLRVEMMFPAKAGEVQVQIPKWSPGGYFLGDNAVNVKDLAADNGTLAKVGENTWKVSGITAKNVTLTYNVPIENSDGGYHFSGPSTYFYIIGRKGEKCFLKVDKPADWKLAVGLDEVKGQPNTFKAFDYDTLADNPVTLGNFWLDTYTVLGRPHIIALRGKGGQYVDKDYLKKACKAVTEYQVDFFKDLPYNKYVWHFSTFDAVDGAGGLEHLSSTQIGLATGVGQGTVSVLSHEFFHLWNVKRIRAKMLGPFDYNVLPKTGTLWWLEGTTDYFAMRILHDYRWWDRAAFFRNIVSNTRMVRSNPAHTQVSPYESSLRMPEENNGRGNSQGYKISYYNLGWLAGLCLDTEIRHLTNNKKSLDDVIRGLYAKTRDNKPGFEEDEIRRQCVLVGGPSMGPFYDRVIMKPGPMPLEEQLKKFGLSLAEEDEKFTDPLFTARAQSGVKGATLREARSPALKVGDIITAMDGEMLDKDTGRENAVILNRHIAAAQIGTPIKLKVRRGEETLDVEVTPVEATRKVWMVREIPGDAAGKAKLEAWLGPRTVTLRGVKLGEKGRG